jgi:hypothetical protein
MAGGIRCGPSFRAVAAPRALAVLLTAALAGAPGARAGVFASHAPTRPLPGVSYRPMADGPAWFVDPTRGDDAGDGSEASPWRTVEHAARALRPGDTLYLRGGVYREAITLTVAGSQEKPITIRSYPGELVVLDRGIPDFYLNPAAAWEPCADGASGEFVSIRRFPDILVGSEEATNVEGNFGDSMIPLHGTRFLADLRSDDPYGGAWVASAAARGTRGTASPAPGKLSEDLRIYCGPGVWYDPRTQRIHVRLAHTRLPGLEADGSNYKGETDPRRLRLVVSARGRGVPLTLDRSRWVRIEDLVVRGGFEAEISVTSCVGVWLEGVTAYGGATVMNVRDTVGLRMLGCALRGCSAPWIFRQHLKYRAIESSLMSCGDWDGGGNRDFDIAWSEFTDSVDGLFLGAVDGVDLHHCFLDNISDDGIFVTAPTRPDGTVAGGDITVRQSYLGRMLTTFAYGVGHGRQKLLAADPPAVQTGAGVWAFRNVFDLRKWVYYFVPSGPDAPQELTSMGRLVGDHGSPTWEPLYFYQNTVVLGATPWRDYYAGGVGVMGVGGSSPRRVLNNILVNAKGMPGWTLPAGAPDLVVDGDLLWSWPLGASTDAAAFLAQFRDSPAFEESRATYPPGWTSSDRFADPRFFHFDPDPGGPLDLRLAGGSPARNAGVPLPPECPDPLAPGGGERPDVGAVPANSDLWRVGVHGRYTVFGQLIGVTVPTALEHRTVAATTEELRPWRSAVLVTADGGPGLGPLVFALRQAQFEVERQGRDWLPGASLVGHDVIVVGGSLTVRGSPDVALGKRGVTHLNDWLRRGGVIVLMPGALTVFHGAGEGFLASVGLGAVAGEPDGFSPDVLEPGDPWVTHLRSAPAVPSWLGGARLAPVECVRGVNVIGDEAGRSVLCRVPVGRGEVVYLGWGIAPLADGLRPGAVEPGARIAAERDFEEQVGVLARIARSIADRRSD